MKKIFSLLLCLTLSVVCLSCAFAEEGELGVIPYTIQALDDTIYIPENMTVTKETESDAGRFADHRAQRAYRLRLLR